MDKKAFSSVQLAASAGSAVAQDAKASQSSSSSVTDRKPLKHLSSADAGNTSTTLVDDKACIEEKVGRWSDAEHKIFLDGLERYGKQWKTISQMIGSRTVVQVRTHAQKYFQKMERKNKDKSITAVPEPQSSKQNKRKSLPASLPSRKRVKSPRRQVSRTASMSHAPPMTSVSPVPTEMTAFVSSTSLSSENLSTHSPSGVHELDLGSSMVWASDSTCFDDGLDHTSSDNNEGGNDPLDWLIDREMGHISEETFESAPVFPDIGDLVSSNGPSLHFELQSKALESDFLDIVDPKVTVQALFLEDDTADQLL